MPADQIISAIVDLQMLTHLNNEKAKKVASSKEENVLKRPCPGPTRSRDIRSEKVDFYLNIMKSVLCLSLILVLMCCGPEFTPRDGKFSRRPKGRAILLWNVGDRVVDWKHLPCGCVLTSDRNYNGGPIDAVVVFGDEPYNLDDLHHINRTANFLLVFADKNPLRLAHNQPELEHGKSAFNFTMTYRKDSDVVWTDYHFATPKMKHQRTQGLGESFMTELSDEAAIDLRQKLQLKSQLVFYFMYEVNEYSLPESLYLQELRKYMELSAFTRCHGYHDCAHYKFMLIFEPSKCRDYVHPQFFQALIHNVVPVMVGGSNVSHLVPPGSYINSADFDSPKKLAEHLEMLSLHPELYEQFFGWHTKYKIHKSPHPYCQLCKQMRRPRRQRQPEEFAKWWSGCQCSNQTGRLAWSN